MDQLQDAQIIKKFGKNLRKIRMAKGLGVRQLALEADLSANTVSQIELGLQNPQVTTVIRLATALDIDPGELFTNKK